MGTASSGLRSALESVSTPVKNKVGRNSGVEGSKTRKHIGPIHRYYATQAALRLTDVGGASSMHASRSSSGHVRQGMSSSREEARAKESEGWASRSMQR